MKYLVSFSFLFVLFFSACNHSNKKNIKNEAVDLHKTFVKPFSDSLKADTFKVELKGNTPEDMGLIFSIYAHNGKQIYRQLIQAKELINNYKKTVDLDGEESQLKFLKEELNLFFEEENFLEPAVTPQEEPDQYTKDKAFYTELKQTGLNGFKYRLGNETKVYIAWSVKDHKVKIYYKCC